MRKSRPMHGEFFDAFADLRNEVTSQAFFMAPEWKILTREFVLRFHKCPEQSPNAGRLEGRWCCQRTDKVCVIVIAMTKREVKVLRIKCPIRIGFNQRRSEEARSRNQPM